MALHGTVRVNAHVIAYWVATRQEPLEGPNETHRYTWQWKDGEHNVNGTLRHRYSDGAAVLMAKVAQAAHRKMTT